LKAELALKQEAAREAEEEERRIFGEVFWAKVSSFSPEEASFWLILYFKVQKTNARLNKRVQHLTITSKKYRMRVVRGILARDNQKTRLEASLKKRKLKAKGVLMGRTREMIRGLMAEGGVAQSKVNDIVHLVAEGLGIQVDDSVSARSCDRVMLETSVAGKMLVVEAIDACDGERSIQNKTFDITHLIWRLYTKRRRDINQAY